MCGIYGQNEQLNHGQFELLSELLHHRGPDARNAFGSEGIGLFHARLSVIDLAGGKQPMQLGNLTIIFNGEIYNHLELRKKHKRVCDTRSDTATLLALYEKLGVNMLSELDGMFAFCIYDSSSRTLFLARDRMGEKPLYYYHKGNHFAFSSELNTLASMLPLEVRENGLREFLVKGWIGPRKTIYENVFILPPGSYAVYDLERRNQLPEPIKWWKYEDQVAASSNLSFEDAKKEVLQAIQISVKRRMESSDLPVGSFLSGGIDSGLVTAIASEMTSNLHTFTFNFEGSFNESIEAEAVARKFGTSHNLMQIRYDHLQEDIGKILLAYGEPYADDSAIPSWYISKEAKKNVTVVLNGDGGDEVFGGYRRYVPQVWPSPLKKGLRLLGGVQSLLPAPTTKMSYYNYLYRMARLQNRCEYKNYLAASTDLFWDEVGGKSIFEEKFMRWLDPILKMDHLTDLRKSFLADYVGLLPTVLLKKIDIATMQHSLESRTVFLSPELLKLSGMLPDHFIVQSRKTKLILRSIAQDLLPGNSHALPKRGFEPPLTLWMKNELNEIMKEYVLASDAYSRSLFDEAALENLVNKKMRIADDRWGKLVFTLFSMEHWIRHKPSFNKKIN